MILQLLDGARYTHYWEKREWLIVSFDEGSIVHLFNEEGESVEVDMAPDIPLKGITLANIADAIEMYIEYADRTLDDIHGMMEDHNDAMKQDKYLEEDFDYIEVD